MVTIVGRGKAAALLYAQALFTHDPRDALVVYDLAASAQFPCNPTVAIAWKLLPNSLNRTTQKVICNRGNFDLCSAVIVGTAREFDRLATPSNGTALGSLTIDESSFDNVGDDRGVF